MHSAIYDTFKDLGEAAWVEVICDTPQQRESLDIVFPGFPDAQIQENMVGGVGEAALREASHFYMNLHYYLRLAGIKFTPHTRVLDFGCGYGRTLRFFMKDVAPGNLIGTDVNNGFIEICKNTFQEGVFDLNGPYPPLEYDDASFDIIYAYSIFTHLSEDAHKKWLKEFRRLIRPGGMIFITLRQKEFLLQCHAMRSAVANNDYRKHLVSAFGDLKSTLPGYVRGEYLYEVYRKNIKISEYYGDSVIPPAYIARHWGEFFSSFDSFDDPKRLAQALIVLRPK